MGDEKGTEDLEHVVAGGAGSPSGSDSENDLGDADGGAGRPPYGWPDLEDVDGGSVNGLILQESTRSKA